jgi:hypothetical protein
MPDPRVIEMVRSLRAAKDALAELYTRTRVLCSIQKKHVTIMRRLYWKQSANSSELSALLSDTA